MYISMKSQKTGNALLKTGGVKQAPPLALKPLSKMSSPSSSSSSSFHVMMTDAPTIVSQVPREQLKQ